LCELHNTRKISLVSDQNLAAIESLEKSDFWKVVNLFEQVIPNLDCSYQDILILVQALVDKAGSDGASGMPNLWLVKWCKANPEKAKLIVEQAKSLDQLCVSHCEYAIQGIEDYDLAFELVSHSNKAIVAAGLRSLGRLSIDSHTLAKRIIDECCNAIGAETNKEVRASAIDTAFKTWEKFFSTELYRQKEFLNVIITQKTSDELIQLSSALFYYQKALIAESIDQILTALAGDVSNPQAVLHWLDNALHSKSEMWSFTKVLNVVTKLLPKLENPIEPNNLYHFCKWVFENEGNTSQVFSSWLISGQMSLCKFLADMIGEDNRNKTLVEISKLDLPAEAHDQIFIAKKCVGFLWCQEVTAASILLSIVKNGLKSAREVAEKLLYNPLLLSYSGELRSFLEQQIKNPSKRISDCASSLIKIHDAYLDDLDQAKNLVELLPTTEQRRAAAMKDRARNNDIQKGAHENSIFLQMISHKTLLYGRKSFFLIHNGDGNKVPSITPLSEFSYTTELPKLSIIDPAGFNEMIRIFQVEKRV
jgi:hypothetical protein